MNREMFPLRDRRNTYHQIVIWIMVMLSLCLIAYSAWYAWDAYQTYQQVVADRDTLLACFNGEPLRAELPNGGAEYTHCQMTTITLANSVALN